MSTVRTTIINTIELVISVHFYCSDHTPEMIQIIIIARSLSKKTYLCSVGKVAWGPETSHRHHQDGWMLMTLC